MNKEEVLYRLGRFCREFRKANKWTQQTVAQCVGVSPSQISNFEHGKADTATVFYWYLERIVLTTEWEEKLEEVCQGLD